MAKQALKVTFSNNYKRLMNEFPNLPNVCMDVFRSAIKRDALTTVKEFKEGIKANRLGLVKLQDGTVRSKKAMGYKKPTYPLYGLGDESKRRSYMNMLRVKDMKNSVTVSPSHEKHHSEALTLNKLWNIHEHGATIKGAGGALIRIPLRPALKKALNRAMSKRKMSATAKVIKTAVVLYIMKRSKMYLQKAQAYFLQGLKQYDIRGR